MADLLPDWMPQQRWFGAKGRTIESIEFLTDRTLVVGDPALRHLLVSIDYADPQGGDKTEVYQLLAGRRREVPERLEHAVIGSEGDLVLYDAAHDNQLTQVLLQFVAAGADESGIAFRHLSDVALNVELTGIVMGAEQSNTSIVFGEEYP